MKTLHAKLLSFALILFIGVSTSGCLKEMTNGHVDSDNFAIFLLGSEIEDCSRSVTSEGVEYECDFKDSFIEHKSNIILFNPGLAFLFIFFDPIIVQVPAGATDFGGTITASNGMSADLDIQAGFTTLPVDINNTMTAEPGMQLVILDFPQPNPFFVPDDFDITFSYQLPPGPGPFEIKAMAAGKVPTEEGTFYPPLFPCVNDFAEVPALSIPESDTPQNIDFSVYDTSFGCDGLVYDYTGLTPIIQTKPIPTISHWGLVAMAGLFGLIAIWAITRRRVAE